MAGRPAIIFADEPTGNLDTATGHAIIELIFARRAALGTTLLIITHDSELAEHCDRVVTMHDGRIRSEEHTSELQSLMRISYAVFSLKKKTTKSTKHVLYNNMQ